VLLIKISLDKKIISFFSAFFSSLFTSSKYYLEYQYFYKFVFPVLRPISKDMMKMMWWIFSLATTFIGTADAAPSDFSRLATGWDLMKSSDLSNNCSNATGSPQLINSSLAMCDSNLSCNAVNYVPFQPGSNTHCTYRKSYQITSMMVSFIHKTRCNANLNGTRQQIGTSFYKYCKNVGDAFFQPLMTFYNNQSIFSWDNCTNECDKNLECSACQTDGHSCTILTTFTSDYCGQSKPGCSAWFKLGLY